jgi:hypothetical protein
MAMSLKPPASAPPNIICEPSEIRAEDGYHLRYDGKSSVLQYHKLRTHLFVVKWIVAGSSQISPAPFGCGV